MIADRLDGKRLNTPNDLAIDRKGRIWFTNPVNEGNWDKMEVRSSTISRCCAPTRKRRQLPGDARTFDNTQTNGILVSPDQRTLYVAESSYKRGVNRELRAYPIKEDGSLDSYDTLFSGRGRARRASRHRRHVSDAEGNIVATAGYEVSGAGPMLYVFSPSGRVLETHPIGCNRPTNVCFGGPDMTTVFVTSTNGHVYKAETDRVGWAMYP